MAFERIFQAAFDKSADEALAAGKRGAFIEGCSYGIASALIYLAEALLFYVGAILIARGTYTYLQMVQVLNLVVFTVTIGSQLMSFSTSFVVTHFSIVSNLSANSSTHCQGCPSNSRLQQASPSLHQH